MRQEIKLQSSDNSDYPVDSMIVQIVGEYASIEYMEPESLLNEYREYQLISSTINKGNKPTLFGVLGIYYFQLPCIVTEVTDLPDNKLTLESNIHLLLASINYPKVHATLHYSSLKPICKREYETCKYHYREAYASLIMKIECSSITIESFITNPRACKKCKKALLKLINKFTYKQL